MNDERGELVPHADMVALDRFACGEMSSDEEWAFLARCEIEPERWRAATLACVEHRRLVAALAGRRAAIRAESPGRGGVGCHRWPRVAALAAGIACVVCGMAAGYRLGRGHMVPPESAATADRAGRPTPGDAGVAASRPIERVDGLLPPAARQVLDEAGIDVHEEPVFYLVDGRDGDRWMIPETQIELRVRRP